MFWRLKRFLLRRDRLRRYFKTDKRAPWWWLLIDWTK